MKRRPRCRARLARAGFRIGYAPRALVYHDVDPARADRARFLRIARERGRCRMIHESHRTLAVIADNAMAALRVWIARIARAGPQRLAREERRLAVAQRDARRLRSMDFRPRATDLTSRKARLSEQSGSVAAPRMVLARPRARSSSDDASVFEQRRQPLGDLSRSWSDSSTTNGRIAAGSSSATPALRADQHAKPAAIASITTLPNGSKNEGSANASTARKSCSIWPIAPRKRTREPTPSR